MKRSAINRAYESARLCFARHQWALPPNAKWDITDFGLGDYDRCGLLLVNLANEPEYCEKIMYTRRGQLVPCHTHAKKKEDIICRAGTLILRLWPRKPAAGKATAEVFAVPVDGEPTPVTAGQDLVLPAGSRVTLAPGVWHEFTAGSLECVIGEVSTANDDLHDNFFVDPAIGRFPPIEEDEPALVQVQSGRVQSPRAATH